MRTKGVCSLLIAILSVTVASAQGSVLDRIVFQAPGVTTRSVCVFIQGECRFDGDIDGSQFSFRFDEVGSPGAQHDALGEWYSFDTPVFSCSGTTTSDLRIFRVLPDNTAEPVLKMSGCSNGPPTQLFAKALTVDAVNGTALLVAGGSGENLELFEIHGLPTLLESIPPIVPCPEMDGDGFADCATFQACDPVGHRCGDCDDNDPAVNPRAEEKGKTAHDGIDNDCNGVVDG